MQTSDIIITANHAVEIINTMNNVFFSKVESSFVSAMLEIEQRFLADEAYQTIQDVIDDIPNHLTGQDADDMVSSLTAFNTILLLCKDYDSGETVENKLLAIKDMMVEVVSQSSMIKAI